ncbi:hypothetical protein EVAR_46069_1 [Eumeta japonica]|uniref:Mos1 transposase HTH domain-containing protein n=1 Tax=Eumeta variegata TaxID=151549 RepID=A0A4C1SMD2_EUMVA|nr:hypothetical protein EVAR_46069_1 [Eumeta japonica]
MLNRCTHAHPKSIRGAHSQQSLARLRTAFDDEAPCKTVHKWFAIFKCSRVNLSDEFRGGQSSCAVNDKNIDDLHCIIETDKFPVAHFSHHRGILLVLKWSVKHQSLLWSCECPWAAVITYYSLVSRTLVCSLTL